MVYASNSEDYELMKEQSNKLLDQYNIGSNCDVSPRWTHDTFNDSANGPPSNAVQHSARDRQNEVLLTENRNEHWNLETNFDNSFSVQPNTTVPFLSVNSPAGYSSSLATSTDYNSAQWSNGESSMLNMTKTANNQQSKQSNFRPAASPLPVSLQSDNHNFSNQLQYAMSPRNDVSNSHLSVTPYDGVSSKSTYQVSESELSHKQNNMQSSSPTSNSNEVQSNDTSVVPITPKSINLEEIYQYISDLTVLSKRKKALLELSRRREMVPDLAPLLWHSFGVITAIIQEIISIYAYLSPPNLTSICSNRVCNALALLQIVASHPETSQPFVNAHVPLLLYPFLNTISNARSFEYLRLTSLGVIGALVKVDNPEVIGFLLQTEILSLCLRIMELGSELSKTVATFIVQKILLNDLGFRYIRATAERFYALSSVFGGMIEFLVKNPSSRLLKHILKCYLRLADHPESRETLKRCIPSALLDPSLMESIKDDPATRQSYLTLLLILELDKVPPKQQSGTSTAPLPSAEDSSKTQNVNADPRETSQSRHPQYHYMSHARY